MRSTKRMKSWKTSAAAQLVVALPRSPARWVHSGIEAADEECGRFPERCCRIVEMSQRRMAGVSMPGTACASGSRNLDDRQGIPGGLAAIVRRRGHRTAFGMGEHSEWI